MNSNRLSDYLTIFYADDDDDDDRDIFTDIVRIINPEIKVHTYNGGAQILSQIMAPPPVPDLVFIDLNMPGVDGFEVLQYIKKSDHRNIPVIIFSTSGEINIINKCKKMGADHYATKPTTFDDMRQCLAAILEIDWPNLAHDNLPFVFRKALRK